MKKGYCGIGLYQPSKETNIGTLFRSAYCFKADFVYTIGRKYKQQSSDTCKTTYNIPYYFYEDYQNFLDNLPQQAKIVCVELCSKSRNLTNFCHPRQAIYLLGNESYGIPNFILENNLIVEIPKLRTCLNVATVGGIILYSRSLTYELDTSKNTHNV